MKKIILILLVLIMLLSLYACNDLFSTPLDTSSKYLSEQEARDALIQYAEPELAKAVEIPTWAFEMNNYKIKEAKHYESLGYWYFEVSGKIPMYDDGLWYIKYEFDARVDHMSGKVTLGELSLQYG